MKPISNGLQPFWLFSPALMFFYMVGLIVGMSPAIAEITIKANVKTEVQAESNAETVQPTSRSSPAQTSSTAQTTPPINLQVNSQMDSQQGPQTQQVRVSELLDPQPMSQVTSVSQLSDVQPTDWAFQALQNLVERYGCIAGYPDGTYRGNRALTRYEFAAGLNACLDRVNELIASGLSNVATREDLATLQRLQEEFATELTVLRGRTDALEARTAELEANQFSTTTRLFGETIFGITSVAAGDDANGDPVPRNPTFGYRVRLNLETSFTGDDLLTTRLQANNIVPLGGTNSGVLGTNEGRLEFDGDSQNDVLLSLLRYRFPIGSSTSVYLAATGNGFVDLDASAQLTPYLDGSAVSLFGLRNPIYNYSGGTGFGLRHLFNDNLELNLGYLTPDAPDPTESNGLFNGKYGALAQLIVYPYDGASIGFTYINSYTPSDDDFGLATGSNLANSDFGRPVVANSYGITGTFDIFPGLSLSGWVGYSNHRYIGRGDGEVWTWAGAVSFPDLGGEGNLGGILVGMEPRLTSLDPGVGGATDPDVSLHLEAFYKYRISDNIDITPGVIWLTAPNHDADNSDVVIGVLRTRFF
ncbi:MAG TPA: iron uptake porin, partial [Crinalium sp.]